MINVMRNLLWANYAQTLHRVCLLYYLEIGKRVSELIFFSYPIDKHQQICLHRKIVVFFVNSFYFTVLNQLAHIPVYIFRWKWPQSLQYSHENNFFLLCHYTFVDTFCVCSALIWQPKNIPTGRCDAMHNWKCQVALRSLNVIFIRMELNCSAVNLKNELKCLQRIDAILQWNYFLYFILNYFECFHCIISQIFNQKYSSIHKTQHVRIEISSFCPFLFNDFYLLKI